MIEALKNHYFFFFLQISRLRQELRRYRSVQRRLYRAVRSVFGKIVPGSGALNSNADIYSHG